jgi:putative nucleotidyltransferase with HDIG domain
MRVGRGMVMAVTTYDQGLKLLNEYIKTPNIFIHSKEVGAIMACLAKKLGKPEKQWELAGLLHDLDYDIERNNMQNHGRTTVEILKNEGFNQESLHAILAHNQEETGVKRETDMDYALAASDNMAGLVHATALVYPDKKISSVKASSVVKRFKSLSFAAGANRENIKECEMINLSLDEFAAVSVEALQGIADEVGL